MQSLNPAADCAGAVRAAEEYSGEWPVQHTGYRCALDSTSQLILSTIYLI